MNILYSSYMNKPKNLYFDGEDKDEHIILGLRRHFITNLGWIIISTLLFYIPLMVGPFLEYNNILVLDTLPTSYKFVITVFWYIFAFGYLFTSFLGWFFNAYLVTNKRLIDIDFEGLSHRRFSEAFLFNIEDLTHQISGALQVIFNYGTLHIQTAGELRELDFELVSNPARVQDVISDLAAAIKRGYVHDD